MPYAARAVALFALLCSARALAGPPTAGFGPEDILGFARRLARGGEYFRAYTELSRLNSYYPGYIDPGVLRVSELFLLYGGGRYDSVLNAGLPESGPGRCAAAVLSADSAMALGDYERALKISRIAPDAPCGPFLGGALCRRAFMSLILLGRTDEAAGLPPPEAEEPGGGLDSNAHAKLLDYARAGFSDLRSPRAALALGAVPGLGYAYAGNLQNGVIAFIVVGVFSALTYFSFRTDNAPLGIVFGATAAVFYGGGMVGAYREALRYNGSIRERIRETVYDEFRPDADRDEIFRRYGIGYGGH